MEPAFTASLNHWLDVLGEAKFVTFGTFAKCQLKETLNSPKRKGIFEKQSGSEPKREIWSDMERTMIIKTSEGFELTFPSLYGTNRCLAKCSISNIWQVCVNPILEIFESRECMHLVKADPPRALKNGQYLDFECAGNRVKS